MEIILFQPEIPQNTGAVLRLAACFSLPVQIIGPTGFPFDDRRVRRAGMDYIDHVTYSYHSDWAEYQATGPSGRLIAATTKGSVRMDGFTFRPDDRLLFGRESAGLPEELHTQADVRVLIPVNPAVRSFNLAQSVAILAAEGLRQTEGLPA